MRIAGARYSAGRISGHTPALYRAQYCIHLCDLSPLYLSPPFTGHTTTKYLQVLHVKLVHSTVVRFCPPQQRVL